MIKSVGYKSKDKKSRTKKDGLEYWKIGSIISIVEVIKKCLPLLFLNINEWSDVIWF